MSKKCGPAHLLSALRLFMERPVLGWGPDVFARPELAVELGGQFTHGHNAVVHLLVVGGLLAAVLFAGLLVVTWHRSLAQARAGRPVPLLFVLALVGVSALEASHLSTTLAGSRTRPPPNTHTPASLASSTTWCAAFATSGSSSSGMIIAPSSNEIRYRVMS